MRNMGRFFCFNHQGKADTLIRALIGRGWKMTPKPDEATFILCDVDIPPHAKRLAAYHNAGQKVFLYPHAARPNLFHDFEGFKPSPHITTSFVVSQGHVELLETIHKEHTYEVIGWFLCPVRPFQPRKQYRKVLFAPIHPNADNSLSEMDRGINHDTFETLLPLVRAGEIELTVRYIRDLAINGIRKRPRINYLQVEPRVSYKEMDEADLVISHQTFAHLAVARGAPTIMMGEDNPPRVGSPIRGDFRYAQSFENYKHLLMFPLDILAEKDTLGLFKRAMSSDAEIADWRRRMIGEPFKPNRFVDVLESYL